MDEVPEDRPSALLTKSQREFLRDENDGMSDRGARAARARIRDRLQASIFDINLIVSTLPLKDIDKALSEPEDYDFELGSSPPLSNAMPSLPALVYLSYRDREPEGEGQPDGWLTALTVKSGIQLALTRMGIGYDSLKVDIEVSRSEDLESLAEGDLSSYSRDRLIQLLRVGLIDGDQFAEAWVEKQNGTDDE